MKFFFWLNLAGICGISNPVTEELDPYFKNSENYDLKNYVKAINSNGYKLMWDEQAMLTNMLPKIPNQGEMKHKAT